MVTTTAIKDKYHYTDIVKLVKKSSLITTFAVIPLSTAITNIAIVTFIIFWAIESTINRKVLIAENKYLFGILIYIFANILSTLINIEHLNATYTLSSLIKISRLLLFFILIPQLEQHRIEKTCINIFFSSCFLSIASVYVANLFHQGTYEIIFKDHIFTSTIAAIYIYFSVSKMSITINFKNIYFLSSIILCSHYLFFINTGRTGQIIFWTLMATFFLQTNFSIIKKIIFLTALLLCLLFLNSFDNSFSKMNKITMDTTKQYIVKNSNTTSMGQRLEFYKNSISIFKENLLFGYGLGSFRLIYNSKFSDTTTNRTNNPHNQYLLTSIESGVLGIFSLIFMLTYMFYSTFENKQIGSRLLQGLVITIALGSLANSWLLDFTSSVIFIFLGSALICEDKTRCSS